VEEYDFYDEYWIEGVGSVNGPLHCAYWHCIVCPEWNLLCHYDEDTLNYIRDGIESCYQRTVGIEENEGTINTAVYPNPFTDKLTIQYELHQSETVTIHFFNQFGVKVDMIEQKQPTGKQQIIWNPQNLPTGVYHLRLQAGDQVASGKVVKR
jgi:hypothetical protein